MELGLHDRVYLVTGGSRGLGFAVAEALIAEGARIVLSSPRETTASAAADRLAQNPAATGDVTWVASDNGDPGTPGRLIKAARERFARLDGALISAGGTSPGTDAPSLYSRGQGAVWQADAPAGLEIVGAAIQSPTSRRLG